MANKVKTPIQNYFEKVESEKVIIFTAFWKYFTKFCEKLKIVSFVL
jgi:ERCC4-related helicase